MISTWYKIVIVHTVFGKKHIYKVKCVTNIFDTVQCMCVLYMYKQNNNSLAVSNHHNHIVLQPKTYKYN